MASTAPQRCYIASPLGFTDGGRDYYRRVYLPALATVVEPVDPWSLTQPDEVAAAVAAGQEHEIRATIGARNSAAIRSCTLLAAYLDGQEPDSGTVAELGYAAGLGLTCFGLRTDMRTNGELGGPVNLQVEAFITESGGKILSSLDALVAALAASSR